MRTQIARAVVLSVAAMPLCGRVSADPVPVRYKEGTVHGYLAVRSLDGKLVGAADLIQTVRGEVVTSHLVYHFRDGSIDDDTAVFTQRSVFRLIRDRHIQRGPIFTTDVDMTIQATTGEVKVRYREKNKGKGEEKMETTHLDLPPDVGNGLALDVAKNISPETKETQLAYVVASPKPRLITLSITPEGTDTFRSAGLPNKAVRFNVHLKLGGFAGLIAPAVGKAPPDAKVWVSAGEVPAFIRSEQPLFLNGPVLRTELVSPIWSTSTAGTAPSKSKHTNGR